MATAKVDYICVAADIGDETIEIPCENDNTILLSTLASTFPGVSGLKYKNSKTETMRALRLTDGRLNAPDEGWGSNEVYYCSFPKENKRKMEESGENESNIKTKRVDSDDSETNSNDTDLIILGLAWKTTEKELTEYFAQYGELEMAEVKIDPRSGRSKGFGFIRFKDLSKHSELVGSRHQIDGRWCDIKLPVPRDDDEHPRQTRGRIFIGRLTRHIEEQDLKEYFSKFGDITDCYIPKPFRGFGFVTFEEAKNAKAASAGETTIKGVQLYVSNAMPKTEMGGGGGGGYGGGYGRGGGGGGWDRSGPYGGGYDRGYERGPPPPYGGYGGYDRAPPRYGGYGGGGYNGSPNHYTVPGAAGNGPAGGAGGPTGGQAPNGNGTAGYAPAPVKYSPPHVASYSDYGYQPRPPAGPGRSDPPTYHTPGTDNAYPRPAPYASYRESYPSYPYRQ